jgi:hypothetical protein
LAKLGEAWRSLAKLGEAWRSLAKLGEAWRSLAKLGEAWRAVLFCAVLCCAGQWCFPARQSSIFDFSSTPMQDLTYQELSCGFIVE